MKRSVFWAVAMALVLSGVTVWAQAESFVGTVKSVTGSSVTVERGALTGVFAVDAKTHVGVRGATAKTKEAQAAGKPGITVGDVVHTGDQVRIRYTYNQSTNKMTVSDITVLESLAVKK
jgi:hypothetical protein